MLLEWNGINPDQANKWSQTPLWFAAKNGHQGVVRTLPARDDLNSDQVDRFGQTPLFQAARIVRMLVEWNDVNPHK